MVQGRCSVDGGLSLTPRPRNRVPGRGLSAGAHAGARTVQRQLIARAERERAHGPTGSRRGGPRPGRHSVAPRRGRCRTPLTDGSRTAPVRPGANGPTGRGTPVLLCWKRTDLKPVARLVAKPVVR